MTFPSLEYQRLWTLGDGTLCLLVEREDAPRFEICVVRGEDVIRQNRLYARGSAQMLAETWRATLDPPRVHQQPASDHSETTPKASDAAH
jgi:hypothetical protein